jgi:hypothetical protein
LLLLFTRRPSAFLTNPVQWRHDCFGLSPLSEVCLFYMMTYRNLLSVDVM